MKTPIVSPKAAHIITIAVVILGVAALFYFRMLWPESLLVIGLGLAVKQFLARHIFDPIATLVIFGAMYIATKWNVGWTVLIPLPALIFVLGAFVVIHEYFLRRENQSSFSDGEAPDDF